MQGATQRFALLALGWAWILFESRKNPKPENYRKKPQNPQRPVHPRRSRAIILYERNSPVSTKVYSEAASTQAVQSNGERLMRLPKCTVVSGQIDLNTGGARAKFCSQSDPDEKANPPQVTGLAKIESKRSTGKWEERANAQKVLRKRIHLRE